MGDKGDLASDQDSDLKERQNREDLQRLWDATKDLTLPPAELAQRNQLQAMLERNSTYSKTTRNLTKQVTRMVMVSGGALAGLDEETLQAIDGSVDNALTNNFIWAVLNVMIAVKDGADAYNETCDLIEEGRYWTAAGRALLGAVEVVTDVVNPGTVLKAGLKEGVKQGVKAGIKAGAKAGMNEAKDMFKSAQTTHQNTKQLCQDPKPSGGAGGGGTGTGAGGGQPQAPKKQAAVKEKDPLPGREEYLKRHEGNEFPVDTYDNLKPEMKKRNKECAALGEKGVDRHHVPSQKNLKDLGPTTGHTIDPKDGVSILLPKEWHQGGGLHGLNNAEKHRDGLAKMAQDIRALSERLPNKETARPMLNDAVKKFIDANKEFHPNAFKKGGQ
jgi:hypothetical protein